MEKEFIPYEQALALKELGFDIQCFAYWNGNKELDHSMRERIVETSNYNKGVCISAPFYQQAFRWFREKYGLIGCVDPIYKDESRTAFNYWFFIADYEQTEEEDDLSFGAYEEAELACLRKLIEIVKTNK